MLSLYDLVCHLVCPQAEYEKYFNFNKQILRENRNFQWKRNDVNWQKTSCNEHGIKQKKEKVALTERSNSTRCI